MNNTYLKILFVMFFSICVGTCIFYRLSRTYSVEGELDDVN